MKTPILKLVLLLALILQLSGCGKTESNEYPIALKLELPASLAKGERRREKFMSQAELLIVKIETKEIEPFEQSYAKEHWEKITLPGFEFPKSANDKAEIKVEIHAKGADGVKMTEAVLKGSGTLSAKEMKKDVQNTLTIKLLLTVQPENWD